MFGGFEPAVHRSDACVIRKQGSLGIGGFMAASPKGPAHIGHCSALTFQFFTLKGADGILNCSRDSWITGLLNIFKNTVK